MDRKGKVFLWLIGGPVPNLTNSGTITISRPFDDVVQIFRWTALWSSDLLVCGQFAMSHTDLIYQDRRNLKGFLLLSQVKWQSPKRRLGKGD